VTLVLAIHIAVAVVAGWLAGRLGRRVFWLAAVAPLSTVVLVVANARSVLDGEVVTEGFSWVAELGLEVSFRVDAFALLMLGIVGGIGVLVMAYASEYFGDEPGLGRFAALLTLFTAAMTGLVAADGLLVMFVFWELTSITSYGLIGFNDRSATARAAATQALLITGMGGLVLLAGVVLLDVATGASSLTELATTEVTGGMASWAAVLILVGCFTKSAQLPFHGWLPGAMAAPTPVSAFLHSATMVKAGVFLIARLSPHLSDLPPWRPLTVTVGLATMCWGGYRALRQTDLKLLLAYGTVSQLGMLVAVFGTGEPKLLLAGTALLCAHAVYKASLFMVVGIIDHSTHTRELERLSGLGRAMPVVLVVAVLGGASMAGVIPLLGFVAKEAALVGLLEASFDWHQLATVVFVAASGFTTAYTLRYLWGGFADRPGVTTEIHGPSVALVAPAVVLAGPTVVLGVGVGWADRLLGAAAGSLDPQAESYHLELWHGWTTAFTLSLVALVIGAALFWSRAVVAAAQDRLGVGWTAADAFQRGLSSGLRGAARVTGVVQSGSLPLYLGVIIVAGVAMPMVALLGGDVGLPADWPFAEDGMQALVAGLTMVAALGVTSARRRFVAVLLLGVVGFGATSIFVLHGAPDLALTQVLIETVTVVVYVLVLRHLPERFDPHRWSLATGVRVVLAGLVGVVMFLFVVTAAGDRTAEPVDVEMAARSYPDGHGRNVVNVTLVDFRGFDTVGEAVVLGVAALGVVSLVVAHRRPAPSTDRGAERSGG
jgi:multicomponent Na+:H+ antiporter subunit A